jgi:catalase (peroxidase I)
MGVQFATVAYQCASTFRATDFLGGCNGARIRFAPQKNWPNNQGLVDAVISRLQPVKDAHPLLSWADLLVLAGTMAVEQAAGVVPAEGEIVGKPFGFCPGRTDAENGDGTEHLAPRSYKTRELAFKDNAVVMGLTAREAVALAGRPRR